VSVGKIISTRGSSDKNQQVLSGHYAFVIPKPDLGEQRSRRGFPYGYAGVAGPLDFAVEDQPHTASGGENHVRALNVPFTTLIEYRQPIFGSQVP
jgi:hypothetical protein